MNASVGRARIAPGSVSREAAETWNADIVTLVDDRTRDLIEKRRAGKVRARGWVMRRALAAADMLGILIAFGLTQAAFAGTVAADRVGTSMEIVLFALSLPLWVVLARQYGLYSADEERADHVIFVHDAFAVFNMLTVGAWTLFGLAHVLKFANPSFPKLGLFWLLALVFVLFARMIARSLCRRTDAYVQNTLIVGAGHVGQRVARKLLHHPEYGVNVVGFVDAHPQEREEGLGSLTVVGDPKHLPQLVEALAIERAIFAFSGEGHEETLDTIRDLNMLGVQVDVVPRFFDVLGPHMRVHAAEGMPLLGLAPERLSNSSLFLKRAFDLVGSALAIVALVPLSAVIALAIKIDSRGPILFRQVRMGRSNRTFTILKFRTMTVDAEARKGEVAHLNKHLSNDPRMFKISGDPRITRIGHLLRRYSIDELPQLVNVFRGDMSLVGPRPLILDEDRHVGGWARRRLDLKPGMTGIWQVLGRDDIPFEEMVGLDYRYVTSWSLAGDLGLILQTIPSLVRQHAE